jgi:hypothetical protein
MRRKDSRVGLDLSDELLQVSTSYKQSGRAERYRLGSRLLSASLRNTLARREVWSALEFSTPLGRPDEKAPHMISFLTLPMRSAIDQLVIGVEEMPVGQRS